MSNLWLSESSLANSDARPVPSASISSTSPSLLHLLLGVAPRKSSWKGIGSDGERNDRNANKTWASEESMLFDPGTNSDTATTACVFQGNSASESVCKVLHVDTTLDMALLRLGRGTAIVHGNLEREATVYVWSMKWKEEPRPRSPAMRYKTSFTKGVNCLTSRIRSVVSWSVVRASFLRSSDALSQLRLISKSVGQECWLHSQ